MHEYTMDIEIFHAELMIVSSWQLSSEHFLHGYDTGHVLTHSQTIVEQ